LQPLDAGGKRNAHQKTDWGKGKNGKQEAEVQGKLDGQRENSS
jgi:hypothetical protein